MKRHHKAAAPTARERDTARLLGQRQTKAGPHRHTKARREQNRLQRELRGALD